MQMSELSEKYKQGSLLSWQRAMNSRCQFSFPLNIVWLPEKSWWHKPPTSWKAWLSGADVIKTSLNMGYSRSGEVPCNYVRYSKYWSDALLFFSLVFIFSFFL